MELMILIVYGSVCVGIFKVFKIPLNKWTVPTAFLGGVVLMVSMLLFMNYNHPHTKLATQYYISTPLIPNVRGKVIYVADLEPNRLVKKGEILFKIDPAPYQAEVDLRRAELASALQNIKTLEAELAQASAKAKESKITLSQRKKEFDRVKNLFKKNAVSQSEFDLKEREYMVSKATYEASLANLQKAQVALESKIDGENTSVAKARAALESAEFDLNSTILKAPTDGFVVQKFLKEGMAATTLPLRPVMTFTQ